MSLPLITGSEDVDAIISYLRTKPLGATIDAAKAVIESRLLDRRKINAYQTWGFITAEDNHLKLTERGSKYHRASPEGRQQIFRQIIVEQKPYFAILEWAFYGKLEQLTVNEAIGHWFEHFPGDLGTRSEDTIGKQVTSFFNIAQAAGLGEYSIGRRGQPTRFTLDRDAVGQLIGEAAMFQSPGQAQESNQVSDDLGESEVLLVDESASSKVLETTAVLTPEIVEQAKRSAVETIRVFISHSKNMDIVEQIKTMIDVAGLEYEMAVEEETTAIPVPEKVLAAMRRCSAAIICVTADEQSRVSDEYTVNENVLIEIGSAFVLYDRKVVLVWDKRLRVPSNLQGLYRCEFEGSELSWTTGMKLLKAISNFKESS